jgi:hypothetical protein
MSSALLMTTRTRLLTIGSVIRTESSRGQAMGNERKRKITAERWVILGLLTVLVSVFAGFAVASAVVTNGNGTVNACYKKNGNLRVATTGCKAGKETAVTLGVPQPAQQLPLGYSSSNAGTSFTDAALHTIVSVAVPAGTYVVNAAVTADNDLHTGSIIVFCGITDSTGGATNFQHTQLLPASPNYVNAVLSSTARLTLATAGTLQFDCALYDTDAKVKYTSPTITAIKVQPG